MEDALASMSRSLPEAFEETIGRIQRLPESRRRLGMNALMWICHARRPLTVWELSNALSVKLGQTELSPKHCPSSSIILECCQGLATFDKDRIGIRLAHYSILEYLTEHSNKLFPRAEADMAATYLIYLLYNTFKEGPSLDPIIIQYRIECNPFLTYAATYYGEHAQRAETHPGIQRLLFAFLASRESVAYSYQIMQFNKRIREEYWNAMECRSVTAMHIASHFGLENILRALLDKGVYPVNATTKMGTTPIIKAASKGHVAVMRILLERGADPHLENWYGSALYCAAEAGYAGSIHELQRHGMDPNACLESRRLPMFCTLDNDRAAALEALVDLGADTKTQTEDGSSIFHVAAFHNQINIVEMILRRRLVDLESKSMKGHTALHYAVMGNHASIVAMLLDAGADVDAKDNYGYVPVYYCKEGVVESLLVD